MSPLPGFEAKKDRVNARSFEKLLQHACSILQIGYQRALLVRERPAYRKRLGIQPRKRKKSA